jgi:cyclopropane fatty-acyl-phospholipid synthase-like methyltransferase
MSRLYDDRFYINQNERSYRSAISILTTYLEVSTAKSLVDVGCGMGSWAKAAIDLQIPEILGIDGDFVDESLLVIPLEKFYRQDLSKSFLLQNRFDLAVSMEVAEHIDETNADIFVENLTNLSDVIIFSAAVPGQGGVHHVNEQPQSYWVEKFNQQGYSCSVELRNRIWTDESISNYYRQNVLMFFKHGSQQWPSRQNELLDVIHPSVFEGAKIYHDHATSSVAKSVLQLLRAISGKLHRH